MATVMVSKALLDEIRAKCNRMKSQEIEKMGLEYKQPEIPVRLLVDEMWGDRLHLQRLYMATHLGSNALNVLDRSGRVDVDVKNEEHGRLHVGGYSPKGNEKFVLPPEFRRYSGTPKVMLPEGHPWGEGIVSFHRTRRELNLKYNAIYDQLHRYLNQCPSLNAAVKALPEILMYISEEYKQRMNSKVERAKTERVAASAESVDVGSLVTAAVAFRIGRTP